MMLFCRNMYGANGAVYAFLRFHCVASHCYSPLMSLSAVRNHVLFPNLSNAYSFVPAWPH